MTTPKAKGGWGLVEIKTKQQALHCQWIKRMQDNLDLQNIFKIGFPNLPKIIIGANLNQKDIMALFGNSFLSDILQSWSKINFQEIETIEMRDKQILWLNSRIRTKGTDAVLFDLQLIDEGLIYFEQIWDHEQGAFVGYPEVKGRF